MELRTLVIFINGQTSLTNDAKTLASIACAVIGIPHILYVLCRGASPLVCTMKVHRLIMLDMCCDELVTYSQVPTQKRSRRMQVE